MEVCLDGVDGKLLREIAKDAKCMVKNPQSVYDHTINAYCFIHSFNGSKQIVQKQFQAEWKKSKTTGQSALQVFVSSTLANALDKFKKSKKQRHIGDMFRKLQNKKEVSNRYNTDRKSVV